jgi:hypothetical protein
VDGSIQIYAQRLLLCCKRGNLDHYPKPNDRRELMETQHSKKGIGGIIHIRISIQPDGKRNLGTAKKGVAE